MPFEPMYASVGSAGWKRTRRAHASFPSMRTTTPRRHLSSSGVDAGPRGATASRPSSGARNPPRGGCRRSRRVRSPSGRSRDAPCRAPSTEGTGRRRGRASPVVTSGCACTAQWPASRKSISTTPYFAMAPGLPPTAGPRVSNIWPRNIPPAASEPARLIPPRRHRLHRAGAVRRPVREDCPPIQTQDELAGHLGPDLAPGADERVRVQLESHGRRRSRRGWASSASIRFANRVDTEGDWWSADSYRT